MTQRKLTEGEIEKLKQARSNINDVLVPTYDDQGQYWIGALNSLYDKIKHGTSDGKPYVEPEPPIPEGWRKATADEYKRRDVQFWHLTQKAWHRRPIQGDPFDPPKCNTHYIVPIDPPLTDEDACVWPRLLVMVRDDGKQEWEGPYRYFGKHDNYPYPYIVDSDGNQSRVWKYARRATPEEIEAAK